MCFLPILLTYYVSIAFLGSSGDDRRDSFVLTKCANGGDEFDFFVEMSVNGMFGLGTPFFLSPPPADRKMKVRIAEIGLVDKKAVELYHDLEIILGIAKVKPFTRKSHFTLFAH